MTVFPLRGLLLAGVAIALLTAALPALAAPKTTDAKTGLSPSATAPAAPAKTTAAPAGAAVFPTAVSNKYASQKPGEARMHTCLDQYHANKATNGNGGMKWIQSGGGYYSACSKKLKAG